MIACDRGLYDDVATHLRFQFGVLVAAILTFLGAGVLEVAGGIAFLPLQAVYAGLTTQIAQGLGIGYRRHAEDSESGGPRPRVPSPPRSGRVAIAAAVQAVLTLAVLAVAEHRWGASTARTMGFATFALTTVVRSFSACADRPPERSRRPLLVAAAVSVGALVLAARAPLLEQLLETEALTAGQAAICLAAALIFLAATRIGASVRRG